MFVYSFNDVKYKPFQLDLDVASGGLHGIYNIYKLGVLSITIINYRIWLQQIASKPVDPVPVFTRLPLVVMHITEPLSQCALEKMCTKN